MSGNTDCYPYPRRYCRGFNEEEDFNDWLASVFEQFGWNTEQELKSRDGTSRLDILATHDVWGTIGIESKYRETARPRAWAEAFDQLQRYRNKEFGDYSINRWAVCVESDPGARFDDKFRARKYRKYFSGHSEFLNYLGYGVVQLHTKIQIVFNNSNPMVKVPVASISYPDGELSSPSLDRLEECSTEQALERLKNHTNLRKSEGGVPQQ